MDVSLPDIITHYQSRPTGSKEDDDMTVDLTIHQDKKDEDVVFDDINIMQSFSYLAVGAGTAGTRS